MLVFADGGKPENPGKNHRSKAKINTQVGIKPLTALVGGEQSHHCVIPTPRLALKGVLIGIGKVCIQANVAHQAMWPTRAELISVSVA